MDLIQKRFDELSEQAQVVEASILVKDEPHSTRDHRGQWSTSMSKTVRLNEDLCLQWQTSALSLISRVFGGQSTTYQQFDERVKGKYQWTHDKFRKLHSIFKSAQSDYEGGYVFDVKQLAHAEIFSDELDQASYFLRARYKVPAAVIAGAVLESAMRRMCEQRDDVEPADNINRMNDALAKAGAYNLGRKKLITAWADTRNNAAHGHPDKFSDGDVERMIDGIREFIAAGR